MILFTYKLHLEKKKHANLTTFIEIGREKASRG